MSYLPWALLIAVIIWMFISFTADVREANLRLCVCLVLEYLENILKGSTPALSKLGG